MESAVKRLAFFALFLLIPLVAGAGQQQKGDTGPTGMKEADRKAAAYSNYILGHLNQMSFEDSGDQTYADTAISYYKKAQELDPSSVEIRVMLAETYAESQRLRDAIDLAQEILKEHPNNLETHRLLAHIYVHSLGELNSSNDQPHLLQMAVEQYLAIQKLDPSDMEAGLWLARLYRFQNQPDKAKQELEDILAKQPNYEPALVQYTQLLLDQGQPQQAIARLTKVAGQAGSGRLYDLLGDAYAQIHDNEHAEQAYRQAVQLEPDVPNHVKRLAGTLFDEEKFGEAAKYYQQLTQLAPSDPENYLRLAEIYYQEKKYDEAEKNIQQAKQRAPQGAPENLEVVYNEALIDEAQGHLSDAVAAISGALGSLKDPSSTTGTNPRVYGILYEKLGRLYRQQGNFPAAIATFKQMMALSPQQQREARMELIETYRENNQIDEAIEAAQQAMAADPQDREMKVTHALLLGEKEETGPAVTELQELLGKTPADREIYLNIAQVQERGHQYGEAEKAARTAESLAKSPDEKSAAWFLLGAIYERQKKYLPASEEFEKALKVEPNNAQILNYYGYMLAEEGVHLDKASGLVKRALAQDANNSAYLDSLGWTYYKQNRLEDAQEYLLKAIGRSPQDPTILGHLGDVYDRLGETNLAITTWEKALAQWRRAVPADYEPDIVHEIQHKLSEAKDRIARKGPGATDPLD